MQGQLDMFGGEMTGNERYEAFVDKFKPKKTTDDCYTPEPVYDAIADWVANEYGRDRSKFVRPFWPGADFIKADYPDGSTVVDNPPFSLMARIVRFYCDNHVPFFVFAPTLTLLQRNNESVCHIPCGAQITYENGAVVNTSFLTNLEDRECIVRTIPELYNRVKKANDAVTRSSKRQMPKYSYPDNVLTMAAAYQFSKYGVEYRLNRRDCVQISEMDAQRAKGKGIFGGGLLLSERAAAERAAAERAAAERAAAERAAAERAAAERAAAERWELSDRENAIIKRLGGGGGRSDDDMQLI